MSRLFILLLPTIVFAQIPEPLQPWKEWVLGRHPNAACPSLFNDAANKRCAWPEQLELVVDEQGGRFRQVWHVFAESRVPLPGDQNSWPQAIRQGRTDLPVMVVEEEPFVLLQAGTWTVTGRWEWKEMPRMLRVPEGLGVVNLSRNGREVVAPRIDTSGRLWLREEDKVTQEQEEDILRLRVYRLVEDDIPLQLTTVMQLEASGKARQINLGQPLPEGFFPLQATGGLPARLDEKGNMVVQVRPGSYSFQITALASQQMTTLQMGAAHENRPASELWSVVTNDALRSIVISGASQVDPNQTSLPPNWRKYPCYYLEQGTTLKIEERSRGLASPPPDSLSFSRNLWLDFDGRGYTFRDRLDGTLNTSWRLDMSTPYQLGRVVVNGDTELVTAGDDGRPGVALRNKDFVLEAEGRIDKRAAVLPASGWNARMNQGTIQMNLPSGWRLFAATGVDRVDGDWLGRWSLWDMFWVLLLGVAVTRLFSIKLGLLMALTMVLIWGEANAPSLLFFLGLVILLALDKALQDRGKRMSAIFVCQVALMALLLVNTAPFAYQQFLGILYPNVSSNRYYPGRSLEDPSVAYAMNEDRSDAIAEVPTRSKFAQVRKADLSQQFKGAEEEMLYSQEVQGKLQTGPGIPEWSLEFVRLYYEGPIIPDQSLRLILLPPWVTRLWAAARLLFLGLILSALGRKMKGLRPPHKAMLAALLLMAGTGLQAQDMPSADMLRELETRLLRPAACFPNCASLAQAELQLKGDTWNLSLEAHAGAAVAIPLPLAPSRVLVNGQSAPVALHDKQLWTLVPEGISQLQLEYPREGTVFKLDFPLKPYKVTVRAQDWTTMGLSENGRLNGILFLRRVAGHTVEEEKVEAKSIPLKPFLSVERTLVLDQTWKVETQVISRNQVGLATPIPLLPGESVISDGVEVKNGSVQVNLGAENRVARWESVLSPSDQLVLQAGSDVPWSEKWHLRASRLWHVAWQGTPALRFFNDEGNWHPMWAPLPGERLELAISRPPAVEGPTFTIQEAIFNIDAGRREITYTLNLEINASIGGEHALTVPDDLIVESVSEAGTNTPIRREGDRLLLNYKPGKARYYITFKKAEGLAAIHTLPDIDLGAPAVNLRTSMSLPSHRWALWTGGKGDVPVVLFWPMLALILLAGWVLSRRRVEVIGFVGWCLLAVGLSQLHALLGLLAVSWFFAFQWRGHQQLSPMLHILVQLCLGILTLVFGIVLLMVLQAGLLGQPNMYLAGNISGPTLYWYLDRSTGALPDFTLISLNIWWYRLLMLAWSLWLANALVRWLRWAWTCFNQNGIWPSKLKTPEPKPKVTDNTSSDPPQEPQDDSPTEEEKSPFDQ